jgi:hypothetical protein
MHMHMHMYMCMYMHMCMCMYMHMSCACACRNERGSTSEGAKMVRGFAETRFRMSDAVLRRTVDAAS